MRKIIGILTFTITLLAGLGGFWFFHCSDIQSTQETFCPLIVDSATEQNQPLNDAKSAISTPDSIPITRCKDTDSIKNTLSYKTRAVSIAVINSRVLCGELPKYPLKLKDKNISGIVTVFVHVNEEGEVAEATSRTGHKLLRPLAKKAAYHTKFPPFFLRGEVHRIFGVLVYQFDSQGEVSLINPLSPKNPLRKTE